jgi:hypothetical protein
VCLQEVDPTVIAALMAAGAAHTPPYKLHAWVLVFKQILHRRSGIGIHDVVWRHQCGGRVHG